MIDEAQDKLSLDTSKYRSLCDLAFIGYNLSHHDLIHTTDLNALHKIKINPSECDFILNPHQIDLWQIPLNECSPKDWSILNTEEQERAKRFHFEHHRRRFVASRAKMRVILARYLHLAPEQLMLSTAHKGKPFLLHPFNIQFNLSHSGEMALLAIGKTHELGVDIEIMSKRSYLELAQSVFAKEEWIALAKAPLMLQALYFFQIWTQKEAFIKAGGLGLSYPLEKFAVPLGLPSEKIIPDTLHQKDWRLYSFMLAPSIFAALCIDPKIEMIRHFNDAES